MYKQKLQIYIHINKNLTIQFLKTYIFSLEYNKLKVIYNYFFCFCLRKGKINKIGIHNE